MMFVGADTEDLVASFLENGGRITKGPTRVCRGNDGKEFAHTRESLRQTRSRSKTVR